MSGNTKKQIILLVIPIALAYFANAESKGRVPTKEKSYQAWIQSVQDKSVFDKLKNITDKGAQKRIIEALKGNCSSQNSNLKKTNIGKAAVNVNHNQCKPAGPQSKGGKDGKKCQISGIQGGSVEAMCLNGCCVQISANKSSNNPYSRWQQTNGQSAPSGAMNPSSQGMFNGLFKNLFKMFSGAGGGDSGGYQPYNYDYGNVYEPDLNTSVTSDNGYNYSYGNSYSADEVNKIAHSNDNQSNQNAQSQSESQSGNTADTETEIYKTTKQNNSKKPTAANQKPIYRAFNTGVENYPSQRDSEQKTETFTENSIEVSYNSAPAKNKAKEYKYYDSSATGFDNSERTQIKELSLWQRILLAIKNALGI